MAPRRIPADEGLHALALWRDDSAEGDDLATAVRYALQTLALEHPGSSIEVRVPPFAAVQCGEGPRHTRGTPPNVIEMDAQVWLRLATGELHWQDARLQHLVSASGSRASLEGLLPVVGE